MWTVFLTPDAIAELAQQPMDIQAKFEWIVAVIREHGIERLREPHVKHIEGKLWEMRLTGRNGIARALYVTASGRRVPVVRVFTKKTEKTPRGEIALALRRAETIE